MSDKRKFDKDKFAQLLTEKGAKTPCQRCGHNLLALIEGYSFLPVNDKQGTISGKPTIPAILIVCNNCGSITPHALGAFEKLENSNYRNQYDISG